MISTSRDRDEGNVAFKRINALQALGIERLLSKSLSDEFSSRVREGRKPRAASQRKTFPQAGLSSDVGKCLAANPTRPQTELLHASDRGIDSVYIRSEVFTICTFALVGTRGQ
jgi:hypothetical protein